MPTKTVKPENKRLTKNSLCKTGSFAPKCVISKEYRSFKNVHIDDQHDCSTTGS